MIRRLIGRLLYRVYPLKSVYVYNLSITTRAHQQITQDMLSAKTATISEHLRACISVYSELLQLARSGARFMVHDGNGVVREFVLDREHHKGIETDDTSTIHIDI